jgi:hypothetical protein
MPRVVAQRGEDAVEVTQGPALDVLAGVLLEPQWMVRQLAPDLGLGIGPCCERLALQVGLILEVAGTGVVRRILDHEPMRDLRAAVDELHRHRRAERVRHQEVDGDHAEALERGREVVREALGGRCAIDRRARAMAALVNRHHPPSMAGQRRPDPPPGPPPAGDAVDEHGDRRASAGIGPGWWPLVGGEDSHHRIVPGTRRARAGAHEPRSNQ